MARLNLTVVTPMGSVVETEADQVDLPGAMGEMGVLADHQPGLIMLGGGTVTYTGGESGEVLIRGGVAEVGPDRVLVLSDEACRPEDADREGAELILEKAIEGLGESESLTEESMIRLNADRAYAEAILKVAGN
jgi:F-type H+-transporting ATPase subunit epsilon